MGKLLFVVFGATLLLQGCAIDSSAPAAAYSNSPEIATTGNSQVANYTYDAPAAGSVKVEFGTSTNYGRSTWSVTTAAAGPVSILVAGMLANTTYHMRADFQSSTGAITDDADQTFTTGGIPSKFSADFTATTTPGQTPQPGIEMLDGIATAGIQAPVATDLDGNIIWTYPFADQQSGVTAFPVRLLNNGNLLMLIAHNSSQLLNIPSGVDTVSEIRQIDLAGDTIQSLSISALNTQLAAGGYSLVLGSFSHDILPLTNGHFIVIATTEKSVTLTGNSSPTLVLGDALIDLDSNMQPVWVWNTFDHLDVNRHPYMFPDWTHANSVDYDPVDGSLIFSLRHQNWVIKIDYDNGSGNGAILWRLGPGGDFTLMEGANDTDSRLEDWFYSQHYAHYLSTGPTGLITLSLMDNGDDRQFSAGQSCPVTGGTYCYTTIPILQIDETNKTATFLFHQVLSPLYSDFGGNTDLLPDGHIQYDLAGLPGDNAAAYEVTNEPTPQTVWSLKMSGALIYRGSRWPSLYPGVQW